MIPVIWSKITKENNKAFCSQGSLQMGDVCIFYHDYPEKNTAYTKVEPNGENPGRGTCWLLMSLRLY